MVFLRYAESRNMTLIAPVTEAAVKRTEGSPPLRAKTRAAPLYSVGPMPGPDHEAIIRFGGEAPKAASRPLPGD